MAQQEYGITQADLEWWLEKAETLEWIFAKTYADTAPHSYVTSINDRTEGLTKEDCIRVGRLIRTLGKPMKYYSSTNIYLEDPKSGKRYWTMDKEVTDTDLINRCDMDVFYGEQNAPSTESDTFTFYDHLAASYDGLWQSESDKAEETQLRKLLFKLSGPEAVTVLDAGCGAGMLLDLGVTAPSQFTGIDPAQGMLNELVRKHPRTRKLHAMTAEQALETPGLLEDRYTLVTATFAAASYLSESAIDQLIAKARTAAVFMFYEPGYFPDYYSDDEKKELAKTMDPRREHTIDLVKSGKLSGQIGKIGAFDTVVIFK